MYDYEESCPISMASSILCERWTLQIIRELFLGSTKYTEILKYIPNVSPSLLKTRLTSLEEQHIILRKRRGTSNRYEYFLTPAGKAIGPLLTEMGKWGIKWASGGMTDKQNTVEGILRDFSGAIDVSQLPGCDVIIQLSFTDNEEPSKHYINIQRDEVHVCSQDMGLDVDIYITTTIQIMTKIWYGELSFNRAIENKSFLFVAESIYRDTLNDWFKISSFTTENPILFTN